MESLRRFRQFLTDTWSELKKTTWPSRKEVYGTTVVVIIFVLICALFLYVVDFALSRVMETLLDSLRA